MRRKIQQRGAPIIGVSINNKLSYTNSRRNVTCRKRDRDIFVDLYNDIINESKYSIKAVSILYMAWGCMVTCVDNFQAAQLS